MRAFFILTRCLTACPAVALPLLAAEAASGQQASTLAPLPPLSPRPSELRPEASAAVTARVSSSSAYERNQVWGGAYSVGGWYLNPDRYALGARYEYTGLGSGQSSSGVDYVKAHFSAHTLWATGRLLPYRRNHQELFVEARLGLTLAHQRAAGTRTIDIHQPAGAPFSCSAFQSPNMALGTSAGFAVPVGEHWLFSTRLGASAFRGSSHVIDDCVPGLGTSVAASLTFDVAYRFAFEAASVER